MSGASSTREERDQPLKISYNKWKVWRARRVNLLVRPVPPAQDRGFRDRGICSFQFSDASPPDLWSSRCQIFNTSVSQGLVNPGQPPPTFVLRPLSDERYPLGLQVSLVVLVLLRPITPGLGIEPFRAMRHVHRRINVKSEQAYEST